MNHATFVGLLFWSLFTTTIVPQWAPLAAWWGGFLNPQPFASSHLWHFFGLVRLLIQHHQWGEVMKPCHLCGAAVLVTFHHHHYPSVGTTGCMVGGFLNPQPFASSHLWYFFGLVRLLIQHCRWGEVIEPCHLCGATVLVTFHHRHCPPVGTTGSGCMAGAFLNPQPFPSGHLWYFLRIGQIVNSTSPMGGGD